MLHHLCWANNLYAMAGSIEHLIRILTDMTNAVEDLDMRWKEKSLKIVAYKPGQTIEIVSKRGRKYIWHVTEGMEALGTWLDSRGCSETSMWHRISKGNSLFYAKRPSSVTPRFRSASAYRPFILLVFPLCFMVQENGLLHKVCSNRCVLGSWVNYAVSFAFEDDQMRAGLII